MRSTPQYNRLFVPLFFSCSFIGCALIVFLMMAPTAKAVDCNVPSGSYATIQSALDEVTCDTIIVAAGTYAETLVIERDVTINGAGSTTTIIDAGGNSRGITIDGDGAAIVVYLNYLRVTNGDATSGPTIDDRNGGGIYVVDGAILHGANLQIDNNIASSSTSGFGGGIAVRRSTAYITDTLIYANTATQRDPAFTGSGRGGGLYVNEDAYLSVVNSQIMSNTAAYRAGSGGGAAGGGLFAQFDTEVYLSGNTWRYNIARGANSVECPLSTCAGGTQAEGGGAIGSDMSSGTAVITIVGDTFVNNIANDVDASSDNTGRGGAIALHTTQTSAHVTATLTHVTMYDNVAVREAYGTEQEGRGGAIFARHTALEIDKSTILDNQAAGMISNGADGYGGGIYMREPEAGDYLTVTNSIISSNDAAGTEGTGAQLYINFSSASQNPARIIQSTLADTSQNPHTALYFNGPTVGDSLWVGNTIIANHAFGIHNVNATGWARARYLLFDGNGQDQLSPGSTAFPGDDDTTFVSGDPLFVNAVNGDYHVQSGSAAVDAGGDEVEIISPTDIDDEPRPYNVDYDIGADEYVPVVEEDDYLIYLPAIMTD